MTCLEKHAQHIEFMTRVFGKSLSALSPKSGKERAVDEIIFWLTGYNALCIAAAPLTIKPIVQLFSPKYQTSTDRLQKLQMSFAVIAFEEIEDKLKRQIRYLDKLIDELATS